MTLGKDCVTLQSLKTIKCRLELLCVFEQLINVYILRKNSKRLFKNMKKVSNGYFYTHTHTHAHTHTHTVHSTYICSWGRVGVGQNNPASITAPRLNAHPNFILHQRLTSVSAAAAAAAASFILFVTSLDSAVQQLI